MSKTLAERLSFMGLGPEAQARIAGLQPLIARELPEALDRFYAQVRSFPETRRFFDGEGPIAAAKSKQLAHWKTISSGRFDEEYLTAVTRIGEVHARIGLEPRWYIGAYALVLERLVEKILAERWPRRAAFAGRGAAHAEVAAEIGAVIKATLLDMDLGISVYLEAAERARIEGERRTLSTERETVVRSVGEAMSALSAGRLAYRMPDGIPQEYAQLRDDFNAAMGQLQSTVSAIALAVGTLTSGSNEIASASDDLSRRTEQQAASLEETAAALDEITVTVQRSADGARQASAAATNARTDAVRSGEVMDEAVKAMGEISESSRQITQIIGVIDEIAFQTNLLALNAGVEAARAGDAGRGFAVVAQEVRALAQRSAEAAREIKALIASSSAQVGRGVELVSATGEALKGIVERVVEIDGLVAEIARSAQEQSNGLAEVNSAVNQMDQVTQQNAAMVEQSTAAAAGLLQEAEGLAGLVQAFDLGQPRLIGDRPELAVPGRHAPATNPVGRAQAKVARALRVGGAAVAQQWEEF
jgi:methyl-accepting chemotaxis protein